ncbi:MAG: TolC family outer membrane protein [bacterium]|nr:TolC family outer membrane protein [bacterium]
MANRTRTCVARALLALAVLGSATAGSQAETLFELYQRARDYDPTYQAARLERQVADELLSESQADVRPTISANADASKVYQNIGESDSFLFTPGRSDFFNTAYSVSLTQPVYRSQNFRRVDRAEAEVRQAVAVLEAAQQDLIFRLAESHFGLLSATDNLEFAEAEKRAIERQLAETEERLTAGLATMTDVHDARGRFALAAAAEIQYTTEVDDARLALAGIVGGIPARTATLSEAFRFVPPEREDVESWVEAALFRNPVVRAREAAAESAEEEMRRQKGARLPTLDLVTSYGDSDSGGTEFGGGNEITTTSIGLRLAVPLYDGGRATSLTQSASLRHRVALQELEREKNRVERETRTAFQRVMSSAQIVDALTQSVFSYEAALAQRTERMRAGLTTGLEVLDARRDLFRAKRERTRVIYRYILDSLRLKQSSGALAVTDLQQVDAFLQ